MSLGDVILDEIWDQLKVLRDGEDIGALMVVKRQAERLAMGLKQYGQLDPIGDKRDWLHELREELIDALTYLENEELRRAAT